MRLRLCAAWNQLFVRGRSLRVLACAGSSPGRLLCGVTCVVHFVPLNLTPLLVRFARAALRRMLNAFGLHVLVAGCDARVGAQCEPVAGKGKLYRVVVNVGREHPLTIVTNAPNAGVGRRVVVATVGAEVGPRRACASARGAACGACCGHRRGPTAGRITHARTQVTSGGETFVVKAQSVGGVVSEGMLCDPPMLGCARACGATRRCLYFGLP